MSEIPSDFGATQDHQLLRETARRLLAARAPLARVRELADDARGYDPALYREMAALGWIGLDLDEAQGGAGLGALGMALLLDEMGRALLPSPYLVCSLAARALAEGVDSDADTARLARVIAGESIATVALSEPASGADGLALALDQIATRVHVDGDDLLLSGAKNHVMWGAQADLVIVPARLPGDALGIIAVPLPSGGVAVEAEVGVDTTRRTARLRFDNARVSADALIADDDDAERLVRALLTRGLAMFAAELTGGIEAVLALTTGYAKERLQFGKPIGAFQAVKHPIVDVMIDAELSRSLACAAAAAIDAAPDAAIDAPPHEAEALVLARMAKVKASEAYHRAAGRGVQLHGGFGFTFDCDVHWHVKRAIFGCANFGDATLHRRSLAAALFDGEAEREALRIVEQVGLTLSM